MRGVGTGAAATGSAGEGLLAAAMTTTGAVAAEAGALAATRTGAAAGGAAAETAGGDVAHHTSASDTMPTATARSPDEGLHVGPGPAGSACLASVRRCLRMDRGLPPRHGAAGLDVDSAQPMRSWPYWFQIGLLPPVNEL